jgi:hypothetical protein
MTRDVTGGPLLYLIRGLDLDLGLIDFVLAADVLRLALIRVLALDLGLTVVLPIVVLLLTLIRILALDLGLAVVLAIAVPLRTLIRVPVPGLAAALTLIRDLDRVPVRALVEVILPTETSVATVISSTEKDHGGILRETGYKIETGSVMETEDGKLQTDAVPTELQIPLVESFLGSTSRKNGTKLNETSFSFTLFKLMKCTCLRVLHLLEPSA